MNNLILSNEKLGILTLTLNNLTKRNALNSSMYKQLTTALAQADAADHIRCVIIQGSINCFCAGNDINDFVTQKKPVDAIAFIHQISSFSKPIIAAVSGDCIGIGTTLLLHCDMVIATNSAVFQLPFTQLGLCPEAGSSYLLTQRLGYNKAFELLVLGESFNANQALQYGLINQITDSDKILPIANTFAEKIATLPSDAVQTTKKLIRKANQPLIKAVIEDEIAEFFRLLESKATQQILSRFFNK